jgi:hypothetical protein
VEEQLCPRPTALPLRRIALPLTSRGVHRCTRGGLKRSQELGRVLGGRLGGNEGRQGRWLVREGQVLEQAGRGSVRCEEGVDRVAEGRVGPDLASCAGLALEGAGEAEGNERWRVLEGGGGFGREGRVAVLGEGGARVAEKDRFEAAAAEALGVAGAQLREGGQEGIRFVHRGQGADLGFQRGAGATAAFQLHSELNLVLDGVLAVFLRAVSRVEAQLSTIRH